MEAAPGAEPAARAGVRTRAQDATPDASDGNGESGAAGADAKPPCIDSGVVAADYVAHAVSEDTIAINGLCNDSVWKNAPSLAFAGPNPTDNTRV